MVASNFRSNCVFPAINFISKSLWIAVIWDISDEFCFVNSRSLAMRKSMRIVAIIGRRISMLIEK